jgi:ribosomal protein S18 acetylase RimI-like enzyme
MLVPKLNHTKPELYIPDLIVSSDHRRVGIGKSLINHCIMMAKKKKCFRIHLESGNRRIIAHKFYASLGFEQYAKTFKLDLS